MTFRINKRNVVILSPIWEDREKSEESTILRTICGALSLNYEVNILLTDSGPAFTTYDGVFKVTRINGTVGQQWLRRELYLEALKQGVNQINTISEIQNLKDELDEYLLTPYIPDLNSFITDLKPDLVVFVGPTTETMLSQLRTSAGLNFVQLPLTNSSLAPTHYHNRLVQDITLLSVSSPETNLLKHNGFSHVVEVQIPISINLSQAKASILKPPSDHFIAVISNSNKTYFGSDLVNPFELCSSLASRFKSMPTLFVQQNRSIIFSSERFWLEEREVTHLEKLRLINSAEIFVDFSSNSPIGINTLYAMLLETPIITVENTVSHAIVDQYNAGLFADSISTLEEEVNWFLTNQNSRDSLVSNGNSLLKSQNEVVNKFLANLDTIFKNN